MIRKCPLRDARAHALLLALAFALGFADCGGGGSFQPSQPPVPANPAPAITSVVPQNVPAGTVPGTYTVNGNGFISSSVVRWNGSNRVTSYVDGSFLNITPMAGDLAQPGNVQITVFNPSPGGAAPHHSHSR